jgi:hypothetical protein
VLRVGMVPQQLQDRIAGLGIQVGGGLVGQNNRGSPAKARAIGMRCFFHRLNRQDNGRLDV